MKTIFRWLLVAASLFAPLAMAHAADKLQVTASFSILGDLVSRVGGDRVQVTTLVGPDEDAHVFSPKPIDAKRLLASSLVVRNGLGFEPWMNKLIASANYRGPVLDAAKGINRRRMPGEQGGVEADPHAWQDPTQTIIYVRNIADALIQLDAAGAAKYRSNADRFIQELTSLDAWTRNEISNIAPDKRKVITSHDAFGYFAARYGVTFLAPQGLSTDEEPGAKAVAKLIRQIQREKIRALFLENMSNPKLLNQIAKDTGAKPGPALYVDALSGADGVAPTYLQMMRHNVKALVAAMAGNP